MPAYRITGDSVEQVDTEAPPQVKPASRVEDRVKTDPINELHKEPGFHCPACEKAGEKFIAKNRAGLQSHFRAKHK